MSALLIFSICASLILSVTANNITTLRPASEALLSAPLQSSTLIAVPRNVVETPRSATLRKRTPPCDPESPSARAQGLKNLRISGTRGIDLFTQIDGQSGVELFFVRYDQLEELSYSIVHEKKEDSKFGRPIRGESWSLFKDQLEILGIPEEQSDWRTWDINRSKRKHEPGVTSLYIIHTNAKDGVVVVEKSYRSRDECDVGSDSSGNPSTPHLSDLAFLVLQKHWDMLNGEEECTGKLRFNYYMILTAMNPETNSGFTEALHLSGSLRGEIVQKLEENTGGATFDTNPSGMMPYHFVRLLLGSPNGLAAGHMLTDHLSKSRDRMIESVTIFDVSFTHGKLERGFDPYLLDISEIGEPQTADVVEALAKSFAFKVGPLVVGGKGGKPYQLKEEGF